MKSSVIVLPKYITSGGIIRIEMKDDKRKSSITPTVILEKYKKIVWREVNRYLKDPAYPDAFKIPSRFDGEHDFHWKIVKEYPQRKGKYLRPTLLSLTAAAMGAPSEKIIKTAAAMQISEDWLLIHDDIEDGSTMRRGFPTLQKIYGVELAINAGDALQIIMWKALSDNFKVLGQQKASKIIDEFYRILTRTTLGQTTEIRWTKSNKIEFDDGDWFFIADGKTSYYTIAGPMRLGAIIAGATKNEMELITQFGLYLGRCFQLVDDILDVTGDFGGLKKQRGNDIYEGKRTVILGHLLRTAKGENKKKLLKILKKERSQKTPADVEWVIKNMSEYGSISYATKLASGLKDKSLKIFQTNLNFLRKNPARKQLETLIYFVLERKH